MGKRYTKTPTIYQMETAECGVACLAMILAFYGRYVPIEQLRIETGVSRDGCNAWNLLCAGEKFGLVAKGYRKSLQSLLQLEPPCVIHWEYNHFVVFEGVRGKAYYINDPAVGRRKLSYEELKQSFTGIVLLFEKDKNFTTVKKRKFLSVILRKRLLGYKKSLAALVILGLLLAVPGLLLPLFLQYFIDEVLVNKHVGQLWGFFAVYASTVLVQAGLSFYRGLLFVQFKNKFALVSASEFLSHMLRLPIPFYEQRYAGDLAERIQNNEDVSDFIAGDLAELLLNLFAAVFYMILLIVYSSRLALLCIAVTGFNLSLMGMALRRQRNYAIKWQIAQGKLMGNLCAGLTLITTLKACGAQGQYATYLQSCYEKVNQEDQRVGRIQQMINAFTESLQMILNVLTLLAGGILVMQGAMTAGMLTAYLGLLTSFTEPVHKLVRLTQKIQMVQAELSRVEDLLCCQQDPCFGQETSENIPIEFRGELELCHISFGYNIQKEPLLSDFNLRLQPGEFLVLTGRSGCGKSTIAKIVSGLYHPWEGKVLLDGRALEEIPRALLSANVSLVGQGVTLFSGTVWENITMWKDHIVESDVIQAAKDACIHDFILTKLEGYQYRLQEGGKNLSGGQRQRLEIARALAVNPKLLILDEATSALELSLEREILENIKRRGCTCLVITHRLSAVSKTDQIMVVK